MSVAILTAWRTDEYGVAVTVKVVYECLRLPEVIQNLRLEEQRRLCQ